MNIWMMKDISWVEMVRKSYFKKNVFGEKKEHYCDIFSNDLNRHTSEKKLSK